ncbi:MFS transporter [Sphingomonas sp.]|uniref:MFS transporter n=1 Tax=Sphingomonas sp. TaxID=28214 RepID=UPI003B3B6483
MAAAANTDLIAARLFRLSIGVFFVGGFLSSLISLFVPRMTLVYGLDYARALLVQLAFHLSYLLFALPIGMTIIRIGYMRSAVVGLTIMTLSCGLFLWSHGLHSYALLLFSLLSLSAGITFLQIAANTVVAVVGGAGGAASRLNLLQAFNSVGTVAAPLVGAAFILKSPTAARHAALMDIAPPFLFAICVLATLALAFLLHRNLLAPVGSAQPAGVRMDWTTLLADRRLVAGALAIFAYTGAEVAIGALLVNYLVQPQIFGIGSVAAARLVSLYWAGAMIGRLCGAFAMRRLSPAIMLMGAAVGAALLTLLAATVQGIGAGLALLAVGLCNSIMYPTIYVLALPADPRLATPGATLLCMAVVGGAIVPLLTGMLADQLGLAASLALPAGCYLGVAAFARRCRGSGF